MIHWIHENSLWFDGNIFDTGSPGKEVGDRVRKLLNRSRSLLKHDHTNASCGHMTYQKLIIHRTHEEEQGIGSLLELVNLVNLEDKPEPSRHFMWPF